MNARLLILYFHLIILSLSFSATSGSVSLIAKKEQIAWIFLLSETSLSFVIDLSSHHIQRLDSAEAEDAFPSCVIKTDVIP